MAREFPLWILVLLPWAGALGAVLTAHFGARVLGPRRAGMFAHYLGLGASTLALLFCVQAIQYLLLPDDPRGLAHTPFADALTPVAIGELRIDSTLVGDRLSTSISALLLAVMVIARMFVPGPGGQRALGLAQAVNDVEATRRALFRFGLLGVLEGGALLVVLAGDLGLAAFGWVLLGIGSVVLVAREAGDERRGDAATHVLGLVLTGDLALAGAGLALVVSGIGLSHGNLWAPLTGDQLYAVLVVGFSRADLIASLLVFAVLLRLSSLVWTGNSLGEVLLDAALVSVPAVYLLLRYQRVLAYAPTVLAVVFVLGLALAPVAAAVALLRPRGRLTEGTSPTSVGRRAAGLCWVGLICMALGVGAWRSVALLLLAHVLGRLGLRVALLVAARDRQLPPVSAAIGRVLCFAVAGLAPGVAFAALAQTMVDVLTRKSLLAPWVSWPAAGVVLLVAFLFTAANARIWYEALTRRPGAQLEPEFEGEFEADEADEADEEDDEDGLDFAPLLVVILASVVFGVMTIGAWFAWIEAPMIWLDQLLPLGGGHEGAPTGLQAWALPEQGPGAARQWVAGCAALVAVVTGYAWAWTRERFRRAAEAELVTWTEGLERLLRLPGRIVGPFALLVRGLCELAAQGLGRGLFEQGPRVAGELARDLNAGFAPRLRALSPGPGRLALLGILLGLALTMGWLYAKPEVASVLPSDNYGFGGLRPRLIRAGGKQPKTSAPAAEPSAAVPGRPQAPVAPPEARP